ncbi:MAG: Omp28-related outer membrane protein [Bacteroidia bacterium]|nr:Omp28-related outer membrane protein [Bacteroidia bacterium]
MKSNIFPGIFTLFIAVSTFYACEEIPPNINMDPPVIPDSTTELIANRILIEDFSGVHCINCPNSAIKLDDLMAQYPGRIIGVVVHPDNIFTNPYPGDSSLVADEATDLESLLGTPSGYPVGGVNRRIFPGESQILTNFDKWAGFVFGELKDTADVKVRIETAWDSTSRTVTATVTLIYNVADAREQFLTVEITESKIIAEQLTPTGEEEDYEHNHVLRKMFTAYTGESIQSSFTKGDSIVKTYNTTLKDWWIENNCNVVAIVHYGSDSLNVINVSEEEVVD